MVASLDFISQLISSQLQRDSIYFDTNSALYPVSHPVLLQTFSSHEFSYVYLIQRRIYHTNSKFSVSILDTFSLPFEVISELRQRSVSDPLPCNIFITDLCNVNININIFYSLIKLKFFVLLIYLRIALCCNRISNINKTVG